MIDAMAERKTTLNLFGQEQAVTEVPIVGAKEIPAEYELEDGSLLRVRYVANAVLRMDGQYDSEGAPVYLIKNGLVTTVLKVGDAVKNPAGK